MTANSLIEVLAEYLESDDVALPVYSAVAAKVQRVADDPNSDANALESALLHDPALSSQVLKVANSAFFAGLTQIDTVKNAIVRLGSNQVVQLAVAISQKAQFSSRDSTVAGLLTKLWLHSLGVGLGARWLAERCGHRAQAAEAFMAGLFHDIGKLVLLKAADDCCTNGRWSQPLTEAVLFELLDNLHTDHGGRLIESWNLPQSYAYVARHHHTVALDDGDVITRLVRLADLACTKLPLNLREDASIALSASPEAAYFDLDEIALAELEIALEDNLSKLAA